MDSKGYDLNEEAFQNKSPVTLENELENYQDLYVNEEILGRTFINNILFKSKFKSTSNDNQQNFIIKSNPLDLYNTYKGKDLIA